MCYWCSDSKKIKNGIWAIREHFFLSQSEFLKIKKKR